MKDTDKIIDGFIEREAARLKGRRHDDTDNGKVVSFIAGGLAVIAVYLLGQLIGAVL